MKTFYCQATVTAPFDSNSEEAEHEVLAHSPEQAALEVAKEWADNGFTEEETKVRVKVYDEDKEILLYSNTYIVVVKKTVEEYDYEDDE